MDFSIYNLGNFKRGEFDIQDECREKSETGNIVSIFDGDVTTYVYEKPKNFDIDDLRNFVGQAYGDGYSSYIATYNEDESGDILVNFDGSVDGSVDELESVCFYDEDGDKEYWEIYAGDKSNLLTTNAYMSVDEVLKARPELKQYSWYIQYCDGLHNESFSTKEDALEAIKNDEDYFERGTVIQMSDSDFNLVKICELFENSKEVYSILADEDDAEKMRKAVERDFETLTFSDNYFSEEFLKMTEKKILNYQYTDNTVQEFKNLMIRNLNCFLEP